MFFLKHYFKKLQTFWEYKYLTVLDARYKGTNIDWIMLILITLNKTYNTESNNRLTYLSCYYWMVRNQCNFISMAYILQNVSRKFLAFLTIKHNWISSICFLFYGYRKTRWTVKYLLSWTYFIVNLNYY